MKGCPTQAAFFCLLLYLLLNKQINPLLFLTSIYRLNEGNFIYLRNKLKLICEEK